MKKYFYLLFLSSVFSTLSCKQKDEPTKTAILEDATINLSDIEPKGIVPTPAALSFALGESTSLSLTGLFPYGKIAPLTSGVTWTVEDETIAKVDGNGIASAVKVGTTRIKVAYKAASVIVPVTVTEAAPMQLILLPESTHVDLPIKMGVSQTQDFAIKAFALMTDGQLLDVTKDTAWVASDADKIEIVSSEKFVAKTAGNYILKANYAGLNSRNKIKVEQIPLKVDHLEATTQNFVMRFGDSYTLPVRAIMNDGTTVTSLVGATLSSSNPQIEFSGTQITAKGLGHHTIQVVYGGAQFSLPVYMREADAVSILVEPAAFSLSRGEVANFTAKATMSDGTVLDVTSSMTTVSLDNSISTVSGNRITAGSIGANLIRVKYKDATADALVTVGTQTLNALDIRPGSFTLAAGTSTTFHVYGIYTNGDEVDLTSIATVSTILSTKADVPSAGTLRSKSAGSTKLSAIYVSPPPESRNLTASANITVQDAYLQSVVFEPTTSTKALGRFEDYKVKGRYSDNTEIDITTVVDITADISSSGLSYAAKIARTSTNRIRVTGREIGSMKVIATFNGISGETLFNATQKEIDRVDIVREAPYAAQGYITKADTANFRAKLTFSDATTELIAASDSTRTIDWSLPDPTYASFTLNSGKMLFTAVKEGPAGFGVTVTEGTNIKSATFGLDIFIPCSTPGRQNSYFCWYMGDVDKSCYETCQTNSRGYHSATQTYAGSGGAADQCKYLVEEVFKDDITATFSNGASPTAGIGCSIYVSGGLNTGARSTVTTSDTAFLVDFRRICSCE